MKYSQLIYVLLCIVPVSIFNLSCSPTETERQKLELALEDVSCTEVWLKVTGETGSQVILNRDGKEIQRFTLTTSPQIVYDDSLLPKMSYIYSLTGINNKETTGNVTAVTLDTTSHNFNWQTYTFGTSSSILEDVAIISENDIWAVGRINIADTSENGYTTYGVMHYNGKEWEFKKVFYKDLDAYGKEFIMPLTDIRGILVFSDTDIWFAAGSILHWDGKDSFATFSYHRATPAGLGPGINKLMGNSSNDLYGIGGSGAIMHYKNGQWSKIDSGTDLPFQDIWGDKGELLSIASDKFSFGGQYLVSISGNTVKQIKTDITQANSFSSIWFISNRKYFLAGDGLYTKHNLQDAVWEFEPSIKTYFYSIRGSSLNNIAVVGENSYIAHFNGVNWKVYNELRSPLDRLSSVAVTGNLIVAVGNKYLNGVDNYGLVYIGRR